MKIQSNSFEQNGFIPQKYSCKGSNINPELHWEDIPENTKSLALIMDDPDAPVGLWVHWILYNIPKDTMNINENSTPSEALDGINSWKKTGYGGPCPPSGTHRYFFKLFALDYMLDLKGEVNKTILEQKMKGHILSEARLMGKFKK